MKPLPPNASFTTYTIKHAQTDAMATNTKVLPTGQLLDVSGRYTGTTTDVATAYDDGNYTVANNAADFTDMLSKPANCFSGLVDIEAGVNSGFEDHYPTQVEKNQSGWNKSEYSKTAKIFQGKTIGASTTPSTAFAYSANATTDDDKNVVVIIGDPNSPETKDMAKAFDKNRSTNAAKIKVFKPNEMAAAKQFITSQGTVNSNVAIVNTANVEVDPLGGGITKANNANLYIMNAAKTQKEGVTNETDFQDLIDHAGTTAVSGHVSVINTSCNGTALLDTD
ncbi:MAG: hypothetical protein QE263_08860 [Vampirovibrionales bacterium]|nr:hypothetical protein [Vampirovibrionales bacterium]